ncbi:MAG: low-specificity L-threonine aldolase [Tatlockia sp.]|jgi:threonine aldolase
MKRIDLRSDTVTKPCKAMRLAMLEAEVGDDVYGEDSTVNRLEHLVAELANKEAAVFAPSGTQSNLMGLMAHCERGDEYLVGQSAHTYMWEGGGAAVLGSIQPQPMEALADGTLCLAKAQTLIKAVDNHHPRTKLLCLENTTAGKVYPLSYLEEVKTFCRENNLQSHLDGARVFHAAVKLDVPLVTISSAFDSVSLCLSKGLGAPVGSVLCGDAAFIRRARRWRKVLGGGMRQAGMLAAAGIYALERNVSRLSEDHDNARFFAQALLHVEEIEVDIASLQTNILFIRIKENYAALQHYLADKGIFMGNARNKAGLIRVVTHLDVSRDDLQQVINQIKQFYATH